MQYYLICGYLLMAFVAMLMFYEHYFCPVTTALLFFVMLFAWWLLLFGLLVSEVQILVRRIMDGGECG